MKKNNFNNEFIKTVPFLKNNESFQHILDNFDLDDIFSARF
jgi:hypothetical protein